MPSCRPDIISEIVYKILEIVPQTILDVGVGYGKWGVLCTEYLTYWKSVKPKIDGVEIFENYKSPAHGVYNKIFYSDVIDILDEVGNYNLVLIIDVIEHLNREDGLRLLDASKSYIVSTPEYWSPQGTCFGNKYETHISRWALDDFVNSQLILDKTGRHHIMGWK